MSQRRTSRVMIQTPEGVTFSMTLAGPMSRFLAWLIDAVTILSILTGLGWVFSAFGIFAPDFAQALLVLCYFVVSVGYGICLEWLWGGRTLGKRLLRLRVIDMEGLKLEFNQVVTRNLLRFVDSLPGLYLVGGVACLVTRGAQRLGDLAANTLVVRNPKQTQPDLSQVMGGKYNSLRDHPHLIARLRQDIPADEARVALQSLVRRDDLQPAARVQLYKELADHFRSKVVFPDETVESLSDEQYVRNVVDAVYRSESRPLGTTRQGSAAEVGLRASA